MQGSLLTKDVHDSSQKTAQKKDATEETEDLNKWKYILLFMDWKIFSILKMLVFLELTYRFSEIVVKIPVGFFSPLVELTH